MKRLPRVKVIVKYRDLKKWSGAFRWWDNRYVIVPDLSESLRNVTVGKT